MYRLALACVVAAFTVSAVHAADKPGGPTHEVQLNGHTFTLPVGFEIELVAGPPLVDRPISAAFDEQGRLYVTDSSGSSEDVQQQLKKKPHRVIRLEDTKGNGHFDKSTVFADQMMFPEGAMWYQGSLYVAAPPSIWKLTDTKGTGVADQRVEWFQGKTLTHCANDLHGPYLGPDGWIYWCKGAFAEQKYERPGKPPFVTKASHIFRCRPDGSGLEPIITGGMDNPVGIAFTPGGEIIFTCTFLQHPAGGKRDGLIHAIYGGVYGKDHNVLDGHKRTSPELMPVLTHLGPAAPCAIIRYESGVFGKHYRDSLFVCQFNMRKVSRHVLKPSGSTFTTEDHDFLVSDNRDFHPTDVIEDADGSLLVIDTGGWYKLCCPTSQLGKPDVLGAIYRVRKKDAPRVEDPRGLKLEWGIASLKQLTVRLDDKRPAVRRRAVEALAARGKEAVPELDRVIMRTKSSEARRNAVWAATRIDDPTARRVVRWVSRHSGDDLTASDTALHCMSLWRDGEEKGRWENQLAGAYIGPYISWRLGAELIGRTGDKSTVPALLNAVEKLAQGTPGVEPDRALEHALIYALIEIGDRESTEQGLKSKEVRVRRAAMIALDQMVQKGASNLEPAVLVKELDSTEPTMRATAWWIISHHPEWGEQLAQTLRDPDFVLTRKAREELVTHFARLAGSKAIQELLGEWLIRSPQLPDGRRIALRAMSQSSLPHMPESWLPGIVKVLAEGSSDDVFEALNVVRRLPLPKENTEKLKAELAKIAADSDKPPDLRIAALAALSGGLAAVSDSTFALLRSRLDKNLPVGTRISAADVLARSKLNQQQLLSLTELFHSIGPMEAEKLLEAFAQSSDGKVGKALLAVLKDAPVRMGLRVDTLKRALAKYGPEVQKPAAELYASLNQDAGKQKEKLDKLLAGLKNGDVRRGQLVFNATKAACSTCHAIGYVGGHVGPDLTRIGQVRGERDLLESIVFPSASIVQGYQPVRVSTKSGKEINGLVKRDTSEEIVLATNATEEVHIRRDNIEDMEPSKISIMPAGFDQQLTPQELADLVAFLRACK